MLFIRQMAGSCRNGFQRDGGRLWHGIINEGDPSYSSAPALCGKRPGRRSAGWGRGAAPGITCPKCQAAAKRRDQEISRLKESLDRYDAADSDEVDPDEYQSVLRRLVELRAGFQVTHTNGVSLRYMPNGAAENVDYD